MNIELPFFHYSDSTCSFTTSTFSARNYPVWILAEFPEVRVPTPPFNLLNSWESIQGSSHTTCLLRISLARPAAKCSPGHSLRTVGHVPQKASLKQPKLWIPKPSAEEWIVAKNETRSLSDPLFLFWTHCLAEQHAKPYVWLNTVLVMLLAFTTPASRSSVASLGLEFVKTSNATIHTSHDL